MFGAAGPRRVGQVEEPFLLHRGQVVGGRVGLEDGDFLIERLARIVNDEERVGAGLRRAAPRRLRSRCPSGPPRRCGRRRPRQAWGAPNAPLVKMALSPQSNTNSTGALAGCGASSSASRLSSRSATTVAALSCFPVIWPRLVRSSSSWETHARLCNAQRRRSHCSRIPPNADIVVEAAPAGKNYQPRALAPSGSTLPYRSAHDEAHILADILPLSCRLA